MAAALETRRQRVLPVPAIVDQPHREEVVERRHEITDHLMQVRNKDLTLSKMDLNYPTFHYHIFYLANKSIKFILAHSHAPCFNAQFKIALHIAKQIFKHMPFATKKIHTIFQKI